MPRYHFHFSTPDQDFPDNIGYEISDLAAAHSKAVQLADRVRMFSALADNASGLRRLTVKVTDERQRSVITVISPALFMRGQNRLILVSGARTLLQRLDKTLMQGAGGHRKLRP